MGEKPTLHGKTKEIDANSWQLWWPLLYGLAQRVGDGRVAMRSHALKILGLTLREHGAPFSVETWRLVFKVFRVAWTS